jgi:hypothetical protein
VKNLLGKSLRGRLTILYGLLLTLALALYAGGTSVYFLHNLRHQLDLSLDRDIETVEGLLSLAPDGHLEIARRKAKRERLTLTADIYSRCGQPTALCSIGAMN